MNRANDVPASTHLKTYTGGGAVFDEPIWDRIPLLATEAKREVFTIGIGQLDPVTSTKKTAADTNLRLSGMRKNEAFTIFGIGFKYLAIAKRTVDELVLIDDMLRNTTMDLFIDSKSQYGQCTLDYIVGAPMQLVIDLAATNYFNYASSGKVAGYWPLNKTIPLSNLVDFFIELEHYDGTPDAALNNDWLKFELIGIKARKAIS